MEANTVEIMNKGMKCLLDNLGIVEAEYFISTVIRENLITLSGNKSILIKFHQMN